MNNFDMISRQAFIDYLVSLKCDESNDYERGKMFERDRIVSCLRSFPSVDKSEILAVAKSIQDITR